MIMFPYDLILETYPRDMKVYHNKACTQMCIVAFTCDAKNWK